MTENPQDLVRYIALAIQCLTTLGILGSIVFGWIGYKKYAKPFAEPQSPKAEEMNTRDAGKTMLTIATVVLVLSLLGSCLGFGLTLAIPTNAPAVTQTPPAQPVPDNQPQQPDSNAPKHDFPIPGEIQVSGTTINAGFAYVRVDVNCFNAECTEGDVYINFTDNLPTNMPIGDAYDGNPLHRRYAFTTATGKAWTNMYKDGCHFAENVRLGYYGSTDFNVYYPNGDGGYLSMNEVPNCDKVPNYVAP